MTAASQDGPRRGRGRIAAGAIALVALNAALVFDCWWPTPAIVPRASVSLEIVALLFALAAAIAAGCRPGPRAASAIAAALTLLVVGRYADVTTHALFGRPVALYWDAPHLPQLARLAADTVGWTWFALAIVAAAASTWWVYRLLRAAVSALARSLDAPQARRAFAASAAAFAVTAGAADRAGWTEGAIADPVTAVYARQIGFAATALARTKVDSALPPSPSFDENVAAVAPADVLLVFVESYGATTFDDPQQRHALAPVRARLAQAAVDHGYASMSAFVVSPTFGGGSWLAHASLMTGVDVDRHDRYPLLLTTRRPTLARHFARHGYRSVAVMPGLRAPWPEGRFYGFDAIHDARGLDYRGPAFGFWRIPDQHAIAMVERLEGERALRRPLFVFFPTITSHLPFRPVPPYQPDWSRLATSQPFDAEAVARSLAAAPDWLDMRPAYVESIEYSLQWLAGLLEQPRDRRPVLVVVGDHQPVAGVSGRDARWDVPIHVFSDRPALIAALRDAGFVDGIEPSSATLGPMHELTGTLLRAFSGRTAPAPAPPPPRHAGPSAIDVPRVDVAGAGPGGGQPREHVADPFGRQPLLATEPVRLAD